MPNASAVRDVDERLDPFTSLPFFAVHLAALVGAFFVGFHWWYPVVALALYYVRMFFVTAGYHRYFSHRAYKTSRLFQFVLALGARTSAQKGVLVVGGASSRSSQVLGPAGGHPLAAAEGLLVVARRLDLVAQVRPDQVRAHQGLRQVPRAALAQQAGTWCRRSSWRSRCLIGGWPLLVWGFFVSTVLLWHGTFTINSLSHVFGSRRYATNDDSKNNFLLALITCGEGWHNNHHYYQSTANQGFFWWEIDLSYYMLKALSGFGLVWDLRTPPKHIRDGGRVPGPGAVAALVAATSSESVPPRVAAKPLD